ncbi:M23 family metallopeptidase [Balneolaceae bacterium ANBcel3]|nr:M23 family metallopeptidase [Balneolaceae bacterium ANBcel3]
MRSSTFLFLPVLLLLLILNGSVASVSIASGKRPAFLSEETRYLWPTNASRYMSSSFGESRAAHFHAAIDIGTWGTEGHPVFASRDGLLHRVSVSPVGYGNVIYLKHSDKSVSLYAHLKDFHPNIRNLVDSLRFPEYRFVFDQHLESHQIHFSKGDLIGWTGSTGVGPPHLHFELRSPEGRPFNPLLAGIYIEDTIPPRFSSIAVEPVAPNSLINGGKNVFRKRPSIRNNRFDFGTIETEGKIGLAVNVFDRANGSNNVHAVYELKMYVNEELFFHSRADSFSYDQSRQMFIDRIYDILKKERRGYQRLYIRNGNTLPFYEDTGHSGILDLEPGVHHIRIIARDFFGNTSEAVARINARETSTKPGLLKANRFPSVYFQEPAVSVPVPPNSIPIEETPEKPIIPNVQWAPTWVRPLGNNTTSLKVHPLGSFSNELQKYISGSNGIPLTSLHLSKLITDEGEWYLHRIDTDAPETTLYHDFMRLRLHFREGAFFESLSVGISGTSSNFFLFPDSEPFHVPVSFSILLENDAVEGTSLFQTHPRTGKPVFISSSRSPAGNILTGTLRSGGHYYLAADTTGPEISRPEIRTWRHNRKPYALVHVEDALSGIDPSSAVIYLNGMRGIAEYDPEKNILRHHHPETSMQPLNIIEVELSDRAGNRSRAVFKDVPYN